MTISIHLIYRKSAVVKTEPVSHVKEEPNSSTNEENEHQQDVKPLIGESSNVIVMEDQQQQPAQRSQPEPQSLSAPQQSNIDLIENDPEPEAGPSGLQRQPITRNQRQLHRRYPNDSSDDDESGDDSISMWRPPASFRYTSSNNDESRYPVNHWAYDQIDQGTNNNDTSNFSDLTVQSASNNAAEIIDLSENDSNTTEQQNASNIVSPRNRSNHDRALITAPDLQLDWLSDSSNSGSNDEFMCTMRDRVAPKKKPQSNHVSVAANESDDDEDDEGVPAIDLTASDDEETSFVRDELNGPSSWLRNMRKDFTHIVSGLRSSGYHYENRNERYGLHFSIISI